jgi:hypothetical protein
MSLSGEITDSEMQEAYLKHLEIVKAEGEAPVHAILDASDMTKLEVKVREMGVFTDTSAAALFGWTIIVTDNRFMKFMITIFSKLTGSQFKTVQTYDEAIAILHKQVPDLMPESVQELAPL